MPLLAALLRLACVFAFGVLASRGADKPNIIVILADDQGFGDFGANNPRSKIPTPNLDRLAAQGMRFTDAHSASAVCTPSRYALLTGRYGWRTSLQSGVLEGFSPPLIAPGRVTIADLLHRQGYATGCFGKWHLGMNFPTKPATGEDAAKGGRSGKGAKAPKLVVDYDTPITGGPLDHGFDDFFGISASLDMPPFVWIADRKVTEIPSAKKTWLRTGPAGPKFEAVDVLPGVVDHAIAFVAGQAKDAKAGRPFFAYVPLNAPHTPIVPTKEFAGTSGINPYADFVRQVDADVGRLLEALERQGLAEDTLVVFTSDNGCSPAARIPELQSKGHEPNHVFRGAKADIFEGGHRVPFVVRWPARVRPGMISEALVGQVDLLATFADLLGVPVAPEVGEDSVSFLPVLSGKTVEGARRSLVNHSINGSFALRDGEWKACFCAGSGGWSAPRPGSPEEAGLPEVQLYNLKDDPSEQHNLALKFPERVAAMRAGLEALVAKGRSTPGPEQANDVPVKISKPRAADRHKDN